MKPNKIYKGEIVMDIVWSVLTCGIYGLFWYVNTKEEMKSIGADIPTAWLIIIPFANLYWLWRWALPPPKPEPPQPSRASWDTFASAHYRSLGNGPR